MWENSVLDLDTTAIYSTRDWHSSEIARDFDQVNFQHTTTSLTGRETYPFDVNSFTKAPAKMFQGRAKSFHLLPHLSPTPSTLKFFHFVALPVASSPQRRHVTSASSATVSWRCLRRWPPYVAAATTIRGSYDRSSDSRRLMSWGHWSSHSFHVAWTTATHCFAADLKDPWHDCNRSRILSCVWWGGNWERGRVALDGMTTSRHATPASESVQPVSRMLRVVLVTVGAVCRRWLVVSPNSRLPNYFNSTSFGEC